MQGMGDGPGDANLLHCHGTKILMDGQHSREDDSVDCKGNMSIKRGCCKITRPTRNKGPKIDCSYNDHFLGGRCGFK